MESGRTGTIVPQHPAILEMLVKANSLKPTKSSRKKAVKVENDAADIIDLGGPRTPRTPRTPRSRSERGPSAPAPRPSRRSYVPNPRLYPGRHEKPQPRLKRAEARANPGRKQRRGKRGLLRPVPNSRLYRAPPPPHPPPPPPPPARRAAACACPPPSPGQLDTASRVALRLGERRPPLAPPAPPAPRRLVVTLPGAAAAMDTTNRHSASPEDCSDGNEPLSAPSEFLAEFLSAIMRQQYAEALKYCRLILQYEPNNATARGFYPLLQLKLQKHQHPTGGDQRSSSEEGEVASSPTRTEEMMEQAADDEAESGGSVASQSSLELDSEPSGELACRTDSECAPASGCGSASFWESSASGDRSDTDDNGNAPAPPPPPQTPHTSADGGVINDNATADSHRNAHLQDTSAMSPTLRRLRAQFACSIK